MFQSRKFYLSLLGAIACLATATDSVFSVLDAVALSSRDVSFVALPIAASALDFLALCCVTLFSLQYAWRREGIIRSTRVRRLLTGCCILLSAVALIISLVSVITIKRRLKDVTSSTSRAVITNWEGYLAGHFAVWAMTCITQTVLYSIPSWNQTPEPTLRAVRYSAPRDSVMSEVRTSNQTANLCMLEATQPSSPLAAISSPDFSARSSQSLKSLRISFHQVVRPVTSRTKLLSRRPSFSRDTQSVYSESHSTENASQADGFETWDTSSVCAPPKESVLLSAPSRGTALEPIPGSRPPSPARALDGPFPQESDASAPLSPPPKILPDTSRPPSPAVSEAHIHPLFRTESPIPPPEITPGTNVLASPLASQMIACPPRPYSRMRSSSTRTTSPNLSMQNQSFRGRGMSQERPSRTPSPPSRELTPPIPDFVLRSSPRSSMTRKSSRNKTTLQLDRSP